MALAKLDPNFESLIRALPVSSASNEAIQNKIQPVQKEWLETENAKRKADKEPSEAEQADKS